MTNGKIEFMLDEEKKVTITSNQVNFGIYLLSIIKKNKDYQQGLSLVKLLSDVMDLFVGSEKIRPTLDDPFRVNVLVHGRENGMEYHTIFGFYQYMLDNELSTALFDGEIEEFPADAKYAIEEGLCSPE